MKKLIAISNRPLLHWANTFFYFSSVLIVLFLTLLAAYYEQLSKLFLVSKTTLQLLVIVPACYLITEIILFLAAKKFEKHRMLGTIIGALALIDVLGNILLENLAVAGNFFIIMIIMILVIQKFCLKNFRN